MRLSFSLSSSLAALAFAATAAITTGCTVHETVVTESGPVRAGAHPAYLRAMADLREARNDVNGRGGNAVAQNAEHDAVAAIDRAIADCRQATADDGNNPNQVKPVDVSDAPAGHLHEAIEALQKARANINSEEDNPNARALRNRANADIDEAINQTNLAIKQF